MENSINKDTVQEVVGKNIKTIRLSRNMTQEQMAEKLNRSVNFVSLIELGKSGMSIQTIIDICNILEVETEAIFKGLLDYKDKEKDRYIKETISALNNKDKKIVTDLIEYIMENREC